MPNIGNNGGYRRIPKERVEVVAHRYHATKDAAAALGICSASFLRLCREYQVEEPGARKIRLRLEARNRGKAMT